MTEWTRICGLDSLPRERGVAALVGQTQVALFRTFHDLLYAVGNVDPKMQAAVMSRGIVGTRGAIPTVASPLLKQVYSLEDGRCLDDEALALGSYPVRVIGDSVEVACPTENGSS